MGGDTRCGALLGGADLTGDSFDLNKSALSFSSTSSFDMFDFIYLSIVLGTYSSGWGSSRCLGSPRCLGSRADEYFATGGSRLGSR